MRVICIFFHSKEIQIEAFAEACYRLTPDICIRLPDAIFLDITRCLKLYREKTAVLRIESLLKKFKIAARVSIAPNLPTALVLAKSGSYLTNLPNLSLDHLIDFADPLNENDSLKKSIAFMVQTLRILGKNTLRDVESLPLEQASSRFGAGAEIALKRMKDPNFAQLIPWNRWKLPEKIEERIELQAHEHCSTLEPLLFKLKEILAHLVARLIGRGLRASRILIEIEIEKNSTVIESKRNWTFSFLLPQGAVRGMLNIIRERLDRDLSRRPIEGEVEALRIEVLETTPGKGIQRNLFHTREEREEAFNAVMGRIAEKLGNTQVFQASITEKYLPEDSWKRSQVASIHFSQTLPYGKRPLRLFKIPKQISRIGRFLVLEDQRWEMIKISPPEKIKTEWWHQFPEETKSRNYYCVKTHSGEQLWVFNTDENSGLYLHGIFE